MSKSKLSADPQELTEFLESSRDPCSKSDHLEPEHGGKESEARAGEHAKRSKEKKGWKRFAGIILALSAGLFLTASRLIIKILQNHHPLNLAFWRNFGYLAPILPYLVYMWLGKGVNVFRSLQIGDGAGKNSSKLLFAAVCSVTLFALRFYSLLYLTMADSAVIIYSGPLFTILLGHFYLKEKCKIVTTVLASLTLIGVVVISRPPFLTGKTEMDTDTLIGVGLAFGSTILAAIYFIMMRGLRKIHFSVVNVVTGCIGLLETGILVWAMQVFQVPEGIREIGLVAALGVFSLLGQGSIVLALKFEEAGTVSVLRMVDVPYSYLFQFLFLSVVPDVYSIVGGVIVLTGVLLITFRKILSTLPEEHGLRRAFRFLLL